MISIRQAGIPDVDKVAVLFDSYRTFYKKVSDIDSAIEFLSARIENNESVIYVAEEDGKLLGFTQLYPLFSSTNMKRLWLLNDLFVDEHHRGKGISVMLIDKAKELCEQTNAHGLMLETDKTNAIGNALYPRAGFTLDAEHNYYYWNIN